MLEEKVQKAFDADSLAKRTKVQINQGFLLLGKTLLDISENRYYANLDYETIERYIAQEEFGLSQDQAGKLMLVYKTFVLDFEIDIQLLEQIDYNKLTMIVPLIERAIVGPKNILEWVNKAKANAYSDLLVSVEKELKIYEQTYLETKPEGY